MICKKCGKNTAALVAGNCLICNAENQQPIPDQPARKSQSVKTKRGLYLVEKNGRYKVANRKEWSNCPEEARIYKTYRIAAYWAGVYGGDVRLFDDVKNGATK